MSRQKLGWTSWKDLAFFFHWEGIAVVLGGLGLAALEFWDIPPKWPLHWFVEDNRLALVVVLTLCVGLPPTVARGMDHLRARSEAGLAQVEIATVLYGVELRLMNLVSKLREAFSGTVSNTYQNHTLSDCRQYFYSRIAKTLGPGANPMVEVNFYALKRGGSSTSLTRKLFTNSPHSLMRSTFSTARGASPEAKLLVKTIASGNSAFCRDVQDETHAAPLCITNGPDRPYRTFLSVPVFADKNSPDTERVIGMLSINSDHVDALAESDASILAVYAWALAVAFEADRHASTTARRSTEMSAVGASIRANGMEV